MDQERAIITGDLIRSDNHEIAVGGGEGLTSFFIPGDIDNAFRENNWSVAEMVEILTNIVRDTTTRHIERRDGSAVEEPVITAREKMAAIKMLDTKAKEAMVLGGLILKDRLTAKKTTADGTEVEYNAEGMRLTTDVSSRLKSTLAILEGASKAKGDKILDLETDSDSTSGDEPHNVRGDGPTGGGPSLLPRRPRSDDSDDGSEGAGNGSGPHALSGGGDALLGTVHEQQRTSSRITLPARPGGGHGPQQDDQGTTQGAGDERRSGLPVQSGRSESGESTGEQSNRDGAGDRSNPEAPKQPVVPGGGVKRVNFWEPGIPRRAPDSDAGSIRDCVTAESSLDRLGRIERARQQAAQAAASYLERREKNKRTGSSGPNESGSGHGRPGVPPDPTRSG